ncbi:hypothetical protein BDV10DRAFT_176757 [Aspergillus recurvatus]
MDNARKWYGGSFNLTFCRHISFYSQWPESRIGYDGQEGNQPGKRLVQHSDPAIAIRVYSTIPLDAEHIELPASLTWRLDTRPAVSLEIYPLQPEA